MHPEYPVVRVSYPLRRETKAVPDEHGGFVSRVYLSTLDCFFRGLSAPAPHLAAAAAAAADMAVPGTVYIRTDAEDL